MHIATRYQAALSLVFALTCFALPLWANEDDAKASFEEAKQLYNQEKFLEAADTFRRAYELKPTWKLLYNIGQSEAAARRYGLALEAFEKYLAESGDEIAKERQEEVREEIQRLREMVGSLDVDAPTDSIVTVDGVERGKAPLSGYVMVAAGVDHHVVVDLDGTSIIDKTVRVSGGQVMGVAREKPDSEDDLPPGSAEPASSPLKTIGWIAVGVGAAALAGGAVTGGMSLSKNKDLESSCTAGSCPSGVDPDIEESRDKLALMTDILIPVGGVLAATGIVLLIVNAVKKEKPEEETNMETAVLPFAIPQGGGGLMIEGRF
jgi:hypothetical protein